MCVCVCAVHNSQIYHPEILTEFVVQYVLIRDFYFLSVVQTDEAHLDLAEADADHQVCAHKLVVLERGGDNCAALDFLLFFGEKIVVDLDCCEKWFLREDTVFQRADVLAQFHELWHFQMQLLLQELLCNQHHIEDAEQTAKLRSRRDLLLELRYLQSRVAQAQEIQELVFRRGLPVFGKL